MSYDFGDAQFTSSSLRYRSQRSYEYLSRTGQQRNLPQVQQSAVAVLDMQSATQAARGGEEWAFTYLTNYYRGAAERVAQHILRTEEAAADAVQDALVKVCISRNAMLS